MAHMESRNGRQSQWETWSQREAWRRAEASCGWAACSAAHAREELTLPSCELPFFRFPETAAGVSTRAEASGSADLGSRCERWTRWKWAASALSIKGFFLTCVHTRAPPGENTAAAGAARRRGGKARTIVDCVRLNPERRLVCNPNKCYTLTCLNIKQGYASLSPPWLRREIQGRVCLDSRRP